MRKLQTPAEQHRYYEDYRSFPETDPTRDTLAEQSRAYDDAVRAAAGGG